MEAPENIGDLMMDGLDIQPRLSEHAQRVDGYGDGYVRVAGVRFEHPLIIWPARTMVWDVAPSSWAVPENFLAILTQEEPPELVIFGTGKAFVMLPPEMRIFLKTQNIAAEAMDTPAACRTFNLLLAEGRRVMAALLMP